MTKLVVDVPSELGPIINALEKRELNIIVSKALREEVSDMLLFKVADEILKGSKMNDEDVKMLSDELKKRVAKKHGLI